MENNIFSNLFKYCTSAPENYLTEALVTLLKEILFRKPEVGLILLNRLAHLTHTDAFTDASMVFITTQVKYTNGQPDIQITDGQDRLVFIEVKHDSPLHSGQLEGYLTELQNSCKPTTNLILLTRSKHSRFETTLHHNQYHHTCWYEVYNWLAEANAGDPVCEFLSGQFLNFLEEKSMNLKRVSWEYMQGIPALLDLVTMIGAAIEEVIPDAKLKKTGGWYWRGYYVDSLFIGVKYTSPTEVRVENNGGYNPTFTEKINLEDSCFFALPKEKQFEQMAEFIDEANKKFLTSGLTSAVPASVTVEE